MKLKEAKNDEDSLIEMLAELEHNQWMKWSKSIASEVSDERKERWEKLWVDYSKLSESDKEDDRIWGRKVLKILGEYIREQLSK